MKKKSHQTIPIVPGSSIWISAVYSHVQMSDLSIAEACDKSQALWPWSGCAWADDSLSVLDLEALPE
jgi:hypothetical protein